MYNQLVEEVDNPYNLEIPPGGTLCATVLQNCAGRDAILRVRKNRTRQLTHQYAKVLCMHTGSRIYNITTGLGFPRDKKFISDENEKPLLSLKVPYSTWVNPQFQLRSCDDTKEIVASCEMKVGLLNVSLAVEFTDTVLNGVNQKLYLKGSRWTRSFDVLLNNEDNGPKIAKIIEPSFKVEGARSVDHYHIHIAEGVDKVLILALLTSVDYYLESW